MVQKAPATLLVKVNVTSLLIVCISYYMPQRVVQEILNVSPRAQPEGERSIFPVQPEEACNN